ncbi:MAG: J domain-containing protein [Betaproteobacteria bacterium]
MNYLDAAKILQINGKVDSGIIKKAYLDACKKYHPDVNSGGLEMMQMVNAAYDVLKDYSGDITGNEKDTDYGDRLNAALNGIYGLAGLNIEVCGSWIWVDGDTKTHKEKLKESGFKYASKKKMWYFRPAGFKSRSRGKFTMADIRMTYGSSQPNRTEKEKIARA